MPDHRIALELLSETGPLAVSSANLTGQPAAVTGDDARAMLGDRVAVYLDDGPARTGVASTIVDATALVGERDDEPRVRILRDGAVSREDLADVLGDLLELPDHEPHAPAPARPLEPEALERPGPDGEHA
jgi:tRNA A37 threonylcarbamoyladenosine synthetase subunit TsaC/SUA5/YrdC